MRIDGMGRAPRRAAFTIIEMMATVAVVGLLATIAIPAYVRYIRRARTAEVHESLDKMVTGAKVYFNVERHSAAGVKLAQTFPASFGPWPGVECCNSPNVGGRCFGTIWTAPTWQALMFAIENVHFYQYQFDSSGADATAAFNAQAFGDLDCDAKVATWRRRGSAVDQDVMVRDTEILPGAHYEIE